MVETGSAMGRAVYSNRHVLILGLTWTAAVLLSLGWNYRSSETGALEQARAAARGAFHKEQAYREWAASHGGIYVPVTETTPANPYLSDIEERDIVTPSGRHLTLVNPSYMTRQVHQMVGQQYGLRGHLTSLTPIRPENAADPWETRALEAFERGETEISSVETVDREPYMRLMKPLIAEKQCLKCHGAQGYHEGDIRGGISVSAPLTPYLAAADDQMFPIAAGHAFIWLLGVLGLTVEHRRMHAREDACIRSEQALMESEERLRDLFENAHDLIFTLRRDGRFSYTNRAWHRALGYSDDDLASTSMFDILNDQSKAHCKALFERMVAGETTVHTGEFVLNHKDGHAITVEGNCHCHVTDGRPEFVRGILRDMSEHKRAEAERRQLEEQLRHTQKMEAIGQLAAGVAHEFNNLLGGVLGNAELLLHKPAGEIPEAFKQPLADIATSGQRAAGLTRQLLTFSRKETTNVGLIDLNQVVSNTERLLTRVVGEHIALETTLATDLQPIKADPGEIEQIIMNLVINACDAMPDGGTLNVRTAEVVVDRQRASRHPNAHPGRYAVLSVIDSGCGISDELMDRIFEPFFTTKATDKGTGLGLSTVFAIVSRAGGYIDVDSHLGNGTAFHVYLPQSEGVATTATTATTEQQPPVEECVGGNETILVCDDQEIVGQAIAQLLQAAGYTALYAESGAEALSMAASHPGGIALLLTDVAMPEMKGHELARKLRRRYADLKVIYMSGYDAGALQSEGSIGADDVMLQKPITREMLLRRVREVISGPTSAVS